MPRPRAGTHSASDEPRAARTWYLRKGGIPDRPDITRVFYGDDDR
jgi:hypothetical protein